MNYQSILYTSHHLITDCGNVPEYFRGSAKRFYLFAITPSFMDAPVTCTEYVDGAETRKLSYRWYKGKSVAVMYAFYWLYFLHVRLFVAPRGTHVITYHPLFCVGNALLRLLRGGRTVFWVFDFFDQYDGLYKWYNRMCDFYVRRLPRVLFLGTPMRNKYAERLGDDHGEWVICTLGVRQGNPPRAPEPGLLGFIGNLKDRQGVEEVMDAMALDASLRLEVVGIGIWLENLKAYAAKAGVAERVRFLGQISDVPRLEEVCKRWQVGVAMYHVTPFTPYADPGKVKLYAQLGIPCITTDVTPIAPDVQELKAGVLAPLTADGILAGIRAIAANYAVYEAGARAMVTRYEFRRQYDAAFAPFAADM